MKKQPESVTVNVVDARKARPFFSFNASYTVDPGATGYALLNDAQCWLSAATEIVATLAMELDHPGSNLTANPKAVVRLLWGAVHLLNMADGAVGAAFNAPAEEAQA